VLTEDGALPAAEVVTRPGQRRFKFRVLQRYGPCCAVCDVKIMELLDAAHLQPKRAKGTDDPRNGLVLCALHYRAFDCCLFGIEPDSLLIACRQDGPARDALRVSRATLKHLERNPHPEALASAWDRYLKGTPHKVTQVKRRPRGSSLTP
jgi:putative restriction endonuclease